MKQDKFKQSLCIAADNPEVFEQKLNEALSRISNPEIIFDTNRSFLAYILYNVQRDVPESVLELLELLDGEMHICEECPHFHKSEDRRKVRGLCDIKNCEVRQDLRACEHFYLWKRKQIENAAEKYMELPFSVG